MQSLKLEEFIPYRLNRIAAEVSRRTRKVYLKHYKLTIPEWRTLATLGQFGEMTATEIGRHSDMHKTKVSRACKALEDRRWITRVPSAVDRRQEVLNLTRTGLRAYDAIVPDIIGFERDFLRAIGQEDAAALSTSLQALEKMLFKVRR